MLQPGQTVYLHGIQPVRIDAIVETQLHGTGVDDGVLYFYSIDKFSLIPRDASGFHFLQPEDVAEPKPAVEVLPEVIEAPPNPTMEIENKNNSRVRAKLSDPLPVTVSAAFFEHLRASGYKLRLLYNAKVETGVKNWFNDNGLTLPTDIRPVKSDMASVSGSLTFPAPANDSILPNLRYKTYGSRLVVNDVRLVVALMKAGFTLNSYAKQEVL